MFFFSLAKAKERREIGVQTEACDDRGRNARSRRFLKKRFPVEKSTASQGGGDRRDP